jgi:molybdenum cofactor cytidylyltransferase
VAVGLGGLVKALSVDVKQSTGRVLWCTIFRPGGRKLLAKGHLLSEDDVRLLETEGMDQVWVTELEEGEIGEDEAVWQAATEMGCGALEIRLAAGGRANLFVTEDSCVLVDDELLRQINCTSSIVIATTPNFTYARTGQRIATVKSTPFAVSLEQVETVVGMLRERGPIFQARPIRSPAIAVLYSDPVQPEKARQLFEPVVRHKLERFNAVPSAVVAVTEEEGSVARGLQHLLRANPTGILVASTSAPVGPEDAVGRGMTRIGCHLERFLAPVEPGNLLLLGYREDVPVVSAPGCYRSVKPNVIDLVLPPILARYRVSGWEVACLGHGGLLG